MRPGWFVDSEDDEDEAEGFDDSLKPNGRASHRSLGEAARLLLNTPSKNKFSSSPTSSPPPLVSCFRELDELVREALAATAVVPPPPVAAGTHPTLAPTSQLVNASKDSASSSYFLAQKFRRKRARSDASLVSATSHSSDLGSFAPSQRGGLRVEDSLRSIVPKSLLDAVASKTAISGAATNASAQNSPSTTPTLAAERRSGAASRLAAAQLPALSLPPASMAAETTPSSPAPSLLIPALNIHGSHTSGTAELIAALERQALRIAFGSCEPPFYGQSKGGDCSEEIGVFERHDDVEGHAEEAPCFSCDGLANGRAWRANSSWIPPPLQARLRQQQHSAKSPHLIRVETSVHAIEHWSHGNFFPAQSSRALAGAEREESVEEDARLHVLHPNRAGGALAYEALGAELASAYDCAGLGTLFFSGSASCTAFASPAASQQQEDTDWQTALADLGRTSAGVGGGSPGVDLLLVLWPAAAWSRARSAMASCVGAANRASNNKRARRVLVLPESFALSGRHGRARTLRLALAVWADLRGDRRPDLASSGPLTLVPSRREDATSASGLGGVNICGSKFPNSNRYNKSFRHVAALASPDERWLVCVSCNEVGGALRVAAQPVRAGDGAVDAAILSVLHEFLQSELASNAFSLRLVTPSSNVYELAKSLVARDVAFALHLLETEPRREPTRREESFELHHPEELDDLAYLARAHELIGRGGADTVLLGTWAEYPVARARAPLHLRCAALLALALNGVSHAQDARGDAGSDEAVL